MAETLLALLLVTKSATESNLVFHWPTSPVPSARLIRARPDETLSLSQFDNPWRASHSLEEMKNAPNIPPQDFGHDPDYCWPRPDALREGALGPTSPHSTAPAEYRHVLGFDGAFLAQYLCPQRSMCHQKFELMVDDLAFLGHPVCVDSSGGWSFRPEKFTPGTRGRGSRESGGSASPRTEDNPSMSPELPIPEPPSSAKSTWLDTFHLVLVLDLPDPSSSASGNLTKYFSILYEQIAFTLTAVLYQEQVMYNFVEEECDKLISLKERCISRGETSLPSRDGC